MTGNMTNTFTTHPNRDEYEARTVRRSAMTLIFQEMFERIDREADGEVYVSEVLDFLQSMADDLDQE